MMRKWEDIFKDKLDGYESALPEGSLSEFHALKDGTGNGSSRKLYPLICVTVAAFAAGLAAVLLLRHPTSQENGVLVAEQPETPVYVDSEPAVVPESTGNPEITVAPKAISLSKSKESKESLDNKQTNPVVDPVVTPMEGKQAKTGTEASTVPDKPVIPLISPFAPEEESIKTVKLKVGPAAGAIAGGGLLAALLTPVIVEINDIHLPTVTKPTHSIGNEGNHNSGTSGSGTSSFIEEHQTTQPSQPSEPIDPGQPSEPIETTNPQDQEEPSDVLTGTRSHQVPIKAALSARIQLSERLNLTTGLEYSRYKSSFRYSISGEKTQIAHYIGIPVRLDWTLASNRWLDVYLGGGVEGDYCVGASLAGERINKDGFSLSLLGAGGLQLNVSDWLGVYLEPQFSYTFPRDYNVLETYRTFHPAVFTLSTGVRFVFGR